MRSLTRLLLILSVGAALTATACTGFIAVEKRSSPPPPAVVHKKAHHPAHLRIPPGHLPPPGQCRVWIPGRPPGHQPSPGRCSAVASAVPLGGWLLYRPSHDRRHLELSVYDARRPRLVVSVGVYEADSGRFVRAGKASRTR